MVRITSRVDGFRRCGVAHPKTATEYPDDRFSKLELKLLQAEPMLTVEVVVGDADKGKGKAIPTAEKAELIKAAATVEELDKLADGETNKGLLKLIDTRRKELQPA